MKLLVAASCILTLLTFSRAHAQEIGTVENRNTDPPSMEQMLGPRSVSFVGGAWLPGSAVHDTGGDLSMEEVQAGVAQRFSLTPRIQLSAGVRYALREIDAPQSAQLPKSLHSVSVNLGGEYLATDRVSFGLRVAPGLSGDLTAVDPKDVTVPVVLHASGRVSKNLVLFGGFAYTGRNHSARALPLLGLLYTPSQQWTLSVGFPDTRVRYRLSSSATLFVGGDFSRGEYHLDDRSIGANYISYRDYRATAGAEIRICSFAKLGVSGGYAFARKFVFYEGERNDIGVDNAPFARLELKFAW